MVATGCEDDIIRIYAPDADEKEGLSLSIVKAEAHEKDVNCVSWNPKQTGVLASCSDDRTVKLWQVVAAK